MRQVPIGIRALVGGILGLAALCAVWASMMLMMDYVFGKPLRPVWEYWVQGGTMSLCYGFYHLAKSRGWLRSVFVDPERMQRLA